MSSPAYAPASSLLTTCSCGGRFGFHRLRATSTAYADVSNSDCSAAIRAVSAYVDGLKSDCDAAQAASASPAEVDSSSRLSARSAESLWSMGQRVLAMPRRVSTSPSCEAGLWAGGAATRLPAGGLVRGAVPKERADMTS